MRPCLLLLIVLVFGGLLPSPAVAQSTDQLLREATAYLERGSCDSARSILAEIPSDERDARVHLLAARTGRCLEDLAMTVLGLHAYEATGGAEQVADEVRRWIDSAAIVAKMELTAGLERGECAVAKTALQGLEAVAGRLLTEERALLAECQTVSEQRSQAAPARAPLTPRTEVGSPRIQLQRRRGIGVGLLATGSAAALVGFVLNGATYQRVYRPETTDQRTYEQARTTVAAGLVMGLVGTAVGLAGGFVIALPQRAGTARVGPSRVAPIIAITPGLQTTLLIRF